MKINKLATYLRKILWVQMESHLPICKLIPRVFFIKWISEDPDGNIIGNFNNNLILRSIFMNAEFPDGVVTQYATNAIAKNVYNHVYQLGR